MSSENVHKSAHECLQILFLPRNKSLRKHWWLSHSKFCEWVLRRNFLIRTVGEWGPLLFICQKFKSSNNQTKKKQMNEWSLRWKCPVCQVYLFLSCSVPVGVCADAAPAAADSTDSVGWAHPLKLRQVEESEVQPLLASVEAGCQLLLWPPGCTFLQKQQWENSRKDETLKSGD